MKIAVLIPAHNEEWVIGLTIPALWLAGVTPEDVYVVDDASSDTTSLIAQSCDVQLLTLTTNVGKSAALYAAIQHFKLCERYDYVAFLDADTRVDPNYFTALRAAAEKNPEDWLLHLEGLTVKVDPWEVSRAADAEAPYLGRVTVETGEAVAKPKHNLRIAAIFHQVEETGINALPIVGLLSFLIGVVLAYQAIDQLKQFGAEQLTVIDAMQTMGLNTVDVLVLPRIIGLVIALPLLTFYADIMALIGGWLMCYFNLGMTFPVFLRQLQGAVHVNTFLVGFIKAPVFAFVIALVGCYEGFQVERNAASVGLLTTRSVVESVFLVIVLDAAFSVMFSVLGI